MIVPMKKAKLVFLKEDEEAMLKALQRVGELMVIRTEDNHDAFDSSQEDAFVQKSQKSLQTIKPFAGKKKPFGIGEWTEVSYSDFVNPDLKENAVLDKIEEIDGIISKLKAENDATKEAIKFLAPWKDLGGKLSTIYTSKSINVHTGYVGVRQLDTFMEALKALENSEVKVFGVNEDTQAILIANWHDDDEEAMGQIKNFGYIEISLPNEDKDVNSLIVEKENLIAANLKQIEEMEKQLVELAAKNEKAIKVFSDQMSTKSVLNKTPVKTSIDTVYLEGWVRVDRTKRVEAAITSVTKDYDLEIVDPEPDEEVPTALQNNKFVKNFESLTDMYSHPNAHELDPNPVMSIWYWMIFGMMMGDAGYGLLLALGSGLMIKLMKPRGTMKSLLSIFFLGSITTMFWGIIFGSYFGASWFPPIWFNPQENPITMLLFTLVIGIIHLCCGLIMKFIMNVRSGHFWDGIFDNISWICILIGLGLALSQFCANMLPTRPVIPAIIQTVGFGFLGVGAVIILLTAGRAKKNIIGKVIGGALGLYGISSYISDVLSYARILALAMSGAIIGYVMNLLADMVKPMPIIGWVFAILIYLVGHLFNLAMNLLSAYVHASRLQYIEFYGKFYEGGGKDFKPLTLEYKYVNEVNDKN